MTKTIKPRNRRNNVTKKYKDKNKAANCPIGLKPFESNFSAALSPRQLKKTSVERKKELVKELLSKFAPNGIKPENNFYDYINYQWLKNTTLENQQKYITQIDDFRLIQHQVYEQLNEIILDYIKTHNNKLSKNLDNFYKSVIRMNPKSYTKQLAKDAVKTIDNLIAENNPWKLLAFFNKDEMISIRAPFVWAMNPDDKNTKVYRCYVDPHVFTILDINVYYEDGVDVA
jgi:predicted metalloendopeptidase